MFMIDLIILVGGLLLLLGIASSKLSSRLGVPVLVLFLMLGMLAGSEGIGGLAFENYEVAHGIGTIALAMILFDGGLSTPFSSVRAVWKPSLMLATVGVLITALLTSVAAAWVLKISLLEGFLLGSIVGSTDAAAVFSVLRSGGVKLPKRISAILELESGSNDPMAIFMTVAAIELLSHRVAPGIGLFGMFLSQMLIGIVFGIGMGFLSIRVVNSIKLDVAGLYPLLVTSACLLTYGLTAHIGGSGFLAVYIAGMILGNSRIVFKNGIRVYHDAVAWFSQIVMFIVLGLLCFPSRLLEVSWRALLIAAVLILIARPLAVLVSLAPFRFSSRQLMLISWVGLKGAVPITLATFPLMMGTPNAALIFDVVFFIVVLSATLQGSTLAIVAGWLGLRQLSPPTPPVTLEISSLQHVDGDVVDYAVGVNSRAAGRMVKDLALPHGVVIALVARGQEIIPPQGQTIILAGDHVILVLRSGMLGPVSQIFGEVDQADQSPTRSVEFPLRASVTAAEFEDMYGIPLGTAADCTLDMALRQKLGDGRIQVGACGQFGPLILKVREVRDDGKIAEVSMSIVTGTDLVALGSDQTQTNAIPNEL